MELGHFVSQVGHIGPVFGTNFFCMVGDRNSSHLVLADHEVGHSALVQVACKFIMSSIEGHRAYVTGCSVVCEGLILSN